ncbi:MAG: hypothetical protein H5T69_18430 [Chloroflexi bacterium]|nr:hypothetical protein [Chloroflexota bacterium]
MERIRLHFLDTNLCLESNSPRLLELIERLYGRFRSEREPPGDGTAVVCRVYAGPPEGEALLTIDGCTSSLPQRPFWEGDACDQALEAVFARSPGYLFLHGAAVNLAGKGILLAGPAHHGKTTLALELARRGFGFLGDDIAALCREDRHLYPFPKSVRLWPDDLPGHIRREDPALLFWAGKYVLDVERLCPGCVASTTPLSHVVLLADPLDPPGVDENGLGESLDIVLDHADDQVLAGLGQLAGVRVVRTFSYWGRFGVRLRLADRPKTVAEIETLCRERNVRLLGSAARFDLFPGFEGPASLRPLAHTLAARALFRQLRGHFTFGNNSPGPRPPALRILLDLARAIGDARCFELRLGPLSEMADLICGLVQGT